MRKSKYHHNPAVSGLFPENRSALQHEAQNNVNLFGPEQLEKRALRNCGFQRLEIVHTRPSHCLCQPLLL
jgi:hypothetical protein